ncbi:MAG: DUF924 family protein [Pseudomonadota bacterium]
MPSSEHPDALKLAKFWMEAGQANWFGGGSAFDEECAGFTALYEQARSGACDEWQATAVGSFALIVLLDQLPRNIYRGLAVQYATDDAALAAANAAVAAGHDQAFPMPYKNFVYLPYQHAEDFSAQERGLDLYRQAGDQDAYYWALLHADVIRRFGRFPHRNALLGRETTAEEAHYLATGGFGA